MNQRLSDLEIDNKAAEAQTILDHPVFNEAMEKVYSRALGTLLTAEVGSLTASTAHAIMIAVRNIRSELTQFISDKKMRQKYSKE